MSFFVVEQQILERVKDKIPELKGVFLSESIASLIEKTPSITPSAYIVYDGYIEPADAKKGGSALMVEQSWIVMLVTRNATSKLYTTVGGKENAGDLMESIIGHLLDWTPKGTHRGLRLSTAPKPMYSAEGVDFYPVAFASAIPVRAIK